MYKTKGLTSPRTFGAHLHWWFQQQGIFLLWFSWFHELISWQKCSICMAGSASSSTSEADNPSWSRHITSKGVKRLLSQPIPKLTGSAPWRSNISPCSLWGIRSRPLRKTRRRRQVEVARGTSDKGSSWIFHRLGSGWLISFTLEYVPKTTEDRIEAKYCPSLGVTAQPEHRTLRKLAELEACCSHTLLQIGGVQ